MWQITIGHLGHYTGNGTFITLYEQTATMSRFRYTTPVWVTKSIHFQPSISFNTKALFINTINVTIFMSGNVDLFDVMCIEPIFEWYKKQNKNGDTDDRCKWTLTLKHWCQSEVVFPEKNELVSAICFL